MKKIIIAAVFVLTLSTGYALNAREINTIQGYGELINRELHISDFTSVEIIGTYDVHFNEFPYFSIQIDIQENLFGYLEATVQNGVLRIESSRNFSVPLGQVPRLFIHAPYFDRINLAGNIDAYMQMDIDSLYVELAGSADFTFMGDANILNIRSIGSSFIGLFGTVDTLNIYSVGATDIAAFRMTARDMTIGMVGAGVANIHATNILDIRIVGTGRIVYDGEPQITRRVIGRGMIERRN